MPAEAVAVALVLLSAVIGSPAVAGERDAAPIVSVDGGDVQGVREADLTVFRGIPFAAAPVGDRRFRPPQPVERWEGVRATRDFGPACPQERDERELPADAPMSEDCLTLNVWSRDTTGSDPVIVFIHGGGFTSGTARHPWYDGASLARHGATVVTVQYRVGPLGWLDLSPLGAPYATSMNNGLLDQMAALAWVRRNIAAFGGDPENLTLAGESAGAISIAALMGAPAADSLYDRVILQSGTAGTVATREWSASVRRSMLESAGVTTVAELRDLDTRSLLEAAHTVYETQLSDTAFHPVVDGELIPQLPARRLASDDGPDVPAIIGTTQDEARYWLTDVPELSRLPLLYAEPWVRAVAGDRADAVIAAYRAAHPEHSDGELIMAMAGDVTFRMPAIRMAESLVARDIPVRMYLAEMDSVALGGAMGSPHSVELPFVFGTTSAARGFVADSGANRALADRVQDLWVGFAGGEDPLRADGTEWPQYDSGTRDTLILDTRLRVEDDPDAGIRTVWDRVRFDGADPGLDRLTPLQYAGTSSTHPLILAAVIGWQWVWAGFGVLALVVAATVWLVVRGRRRHRPTRVSRAAPPFSHPS